MKKELLKVSLPFLTAIALSFGIASCSNSDSSSTENKDSKEVAEDQNDAKFDHAQSKDADFVVAAATINMQEILMGNMVGEHAKMQSTKELGKMMVEEHQKALNDLTSLAKQKSISIPSALSDEDMKDYKKLMDDKPSDFDKDYSDMMVDGHKNAIDKFETASKDCEDADIKLWASNMLPSLRHHLDMAMENQDKAKKAK